MLSLLQTGDDSQGLGISFEAAPIPHLQVEGFLALMTERRMAKVMAPSGKLHQVDIQAVGSLPFKRLVVEANSDGLCDLSNLERMRQAVSKIIGLGTGKELCLSLQATKRRRVCEASRISPSGGAVFLDRQIDGDC